MQFQTYIYRTQRFTHQKGTEKLVKVELCIYVANKVILKLRIFSRRYNFRLWIFALTPEYRYY